MCKRICRNGVFRVALDAVVGRSPDRHTGACRNGVFLVALGMILAVLANVVRADIPPDPGRRPTRQRPVVKRVSPDVSRPLTIRIDPRQQTSRIIIPKGYLSAAAVPAPTVSSWSPQSRSIIAGLALSLVMASGFLMLVFARQRRLSLATLATTAALAGVLLIVGTAVADLLPPGGGPARTNRTFRAPPEPPRSGIVIETTSGGNEVVLILGRDAIQSLK